MLGEDFANHGYPVIPALYDYRRERVVNGIDIADVGLFL
ncbi:hypothetical protein JCM19233_4691 [Vibrio astriarenae]|nr:hypothetical protein JCM19233_4691 [Vibrio sp. C7]